MDIQEVCVCVWGGSLELHKTTDRRTDRLTQTPLGTQNWISTGGKFVQGTSPSALSKPDLYQLALINVFKLWRPCPTDVFSTHCRLATLIKRNENEHHHLAFLVVQWTQQSRNSCEGPLFDTSVSVSPPSHCRLYVWTSAAVSPLFRTLVVSPKKAKAFPLELSSF